MATQTIPTIANSGSSIDQLLASIVKGYGAGANGGAGQSTPGFTKELGSLLGNLVNNTGPFSKQQAIDDSTGAITNLARGRLQSVVPQLSAGMRASGLYNSTTNQLLANDAQAKIVAEMADVVQKNINNYAQINQGNVQAGANASQAARTVGAQGGSAGVKSALQQGLLGIGLSEGKKGLAKLFADEAAPAASAAGSDVSSLIASAFSDPSRALDVFPGTESVGADVFSGNVADDYATDFFGGELVTDFFGGAGDVIDSIGSGFSDAFAGIGDALSGVFGGFFADGGKTPTPTKRVPIEGKIDPVKMLQDLMPLFKQINNRRASQAGGMDPEGNEIKAPAAGEIPGQKTSSGKDTMLIAVGGGEYMIPADVLEEPGVEQLLDMLIENFHTPVEA